MNVRNSNVAVSMLYENNFTKLDDKNLETNV